MVVMWKDWDVEEDEGSEGGGYKGGKRGVRERRLETGGSNCSLRGLELLIMRSLYVIKACSYERQVSKNRTIQPNKGKCKTGVSGCTRLGRLTHIIQLFSFIINAEKLKRQNNR